MPQRRRLARADATEADAARAVERLARAARPERCEAGGEDCELHGRALWPAPRLRLGGEQQGRAGKAGRRERQSLDAQAVAVGLGHGGSLFRRRLARGPAPRPYASLDAAQMLMPASTACWSISASSSGEKSRCSSAPRVSSSCRTLEAPTSADVTRGSRSVHAIAIWASVCPRRCAISLRPRTRTRFSSVRKSGVRNTP